MNTTDWGVGEWTAAVSFAAWILSTWTAGVYWCTVIYLELRSLKKHVTTVSRDNSDAHRRLWDAQCETDRQLAEHATMLGRLDVRVTNLEGS